MKFLFDDDSFSFEALRTTGFAAYGGADLGEVLATASKIGEGDEAGWHQAWKTTAQRVARIGEQALAAAIGREGPHRRVHHSGHVDRKRGGRRAHPCRWAGPGPPDDVRLARRHSSRAT